jgi:Carboxypeptidase regulatory-like domain
MKTTTLPNSTKVLLEVFLLSVLLLVVFAASGVAQTTTSTIEGTVTDSKKAVVAGAQIKIKNTELGVERDAVSDANGFFRVTALPAGTYSLTVYAQPHSRLRCAVGSWFGARAGRGQCGRTVDRFFVRGNRVHYHSATDREFASKRSQLPRPVATRTRGCHQSTGQRRQRQLNSCVRRESRKQQFPHRWSTE